jgi:hypothetical protein
MGRKRPRAWSGRELDFEWLRVVFAAGKSFLADEKGDEMTGWIERDAFRALHCRRMPTLCGSVKWARSGPRPELR